MDPEEGNTEQHDEEQTSPRKEYYMSYLRGLGIIVYLCLLVVPLGIALSCFSIAVEVVVGCIFLVLGPWFYIVYWSLGHAIKNEELGSTSSSTSPESGPSLMYTGAGRKAIQLSRRVSCFLIFLGWLSLLLGVWLVLNTSIPRLRNRLTLLGSPLWKWSLLGVAIAAGPFEAIALVKLTSFLIRLLAGLDKEKLGPGAYVGGEAVLVSIHVILYFGMLLLSWLFFFGTHHHGLITIDHHHHHQTIFNFGTWSFASLFLGSILWLVRAILLFKWSYDAIYMRFQQRITLTAFKYYFLTRLTLAPASSVNADRIRNYEGALSLLRDSGFHRWEPTESSLTKYLKSKSKLALHQLISAARILESLEEIASSREEDGILDIIKWFEAKAIPGSNKCGPEDIQRLLARADEIPDQRPLIRKLFSRLKSELSIYPVKKKEYDPHQKLAQVLCHMVREECRSLHDITYDDLKKWMVDAHKDCMFMGRTIADAKAIVGSLNILVSCAIFAVILPSWLLITGIASTKVLATIAAPILALTFIFDDSSKTFFQGLIFCFATHPFDVGDRCMVDETELEVKNVSILTTTFIKIGTKEKRLYPNSELAVKTIINLGWQPDPDDVVELTLDPSTDLKKLEQKINKFFIEENQRYRESCQVMIEKVGDKITAVVHFTHILSVHDISHSQCSKKKREQRSYFLKVIKEYLYGASQVVPVAVDMREVEIVECPSGM